MQDVQTDYPLNRKDIIDRLRAQLEHHLRMHAVPADLDEVIEHGLELSRYQREHWLTQWRALGLSRVRLETVPSDPWQIGQDRGDEAFAKFRNAGCSAVASSADQGWSLLSEVSADAQGTYLVPQELRDEKLQAHTWGTKKVNGSVGDSDVEKVQTLYVDVDAKKAAPGMASEPEVWEAFEVASELYADLVDLLGGEAGLGFLFSGNGFQIWLFHEPADPEKMRVARAKLLHSVAALYSRDHAGRVDTSVRDLRRIGPVAGSWKRKPRSEGRPHRIVGFWVAVPGRISERSLLELVAHFDKLAPAPEGLIARPVQRTARGENDGYCARANQEDIREVWALLGGGSRLVCPGCGGDDQGEVRFSPFNTIHCFRDKCVAKRSHSVIDLVCWKLGLPFSEHARAYDWLGERRGLPAREVPESYQLTEEPGMTLDDEDATPLCQEEMSPKSGAAVA